MQQGLCCKCWYMQHAVFIGGGETKKRCSAFGILLQDEAVICSEFSPKGRDQFLEQVADAAIDNRS